MKEKARKKQGRAAKKSSEQSEAQDKLIFCLTRWNEPKRSSLDDFYLSVQLIGKFTLNDQQKKMLDSLLKTKLQKAEESSGLHYRDKQGSRAEIGKVLKKLLNILYGD